MEILRTVLSIFFVAALAYGLAFLILTLIPGGPAPLSTWLRRAMCRLNGYRFLGGQNVIFQKRSTGCGAACLEMVLRQLRVSYEPEEMRTIRESRGTSMLDLKNYLGGFGVSSEGRRFAGVSELEASLQSRGCALVLFNAAYFVSRDNPLFFPFYHLLRYCLRGNFDLLRHWVLIAGRSPEGSLVVRDPHIGEVSLPRERFRRLWDGTALLVLKP